MTLAGDRLHRWPRLGEFDSIVLHIHSLSMLHSTSNPVPLLDDVVPSVAAWQPMRFQSSLRSLTFRLCRGAWTLVLPVCHSDGGT